MKKIIKITLLLIILQNSVIFASYKWTCVLPFQYDKKGNLWVLLGQENNGGYVWSDFCGRKDRKDKNPFDTAIREAKEETARQLKFRRFKRGEPFSYRDGSTVNYILPVYYINTDKINNAAQELRRKGRGRTIEKTAWQWVKAKDLLRDRTQLKLDEAFSKKLQTQSYRQYLETLIAKKPLIAMKKLTKKQGVYRKKRSKYKNGIYKKRKKCPKGKKICTCPR